MPEDIDMPTDMPNEGDETEGVLSPRALGQSQEQMNLVGWIRNKYGESALSDIARLVIDEYNIDVESRREWEQNVAKAIKLFICNSERIEKPWIGASEAVLPFISIACLQFHARAYDALFPAKGIVQAVPVSADDYDKASRVEKHMNYQLLYEMEDFEEGMDASLMQLPIIGSVFRKTYYDPIDKMVKSTYVSAQDFVVNYSYRVPIEDVRRKTHVLHLTNSEVRERIARGIYEDIGQLAPPSVLSSSPTPIRDAVDSAFGTTQHLPFTSYDTASTRTILEQHRWLDLDGDGIEEPYIVTVDLDTQKILRITSRRIYTFNGYMDIEYFTHYKFLPNPEGFYGLGFWILLGGINTAANAILNNIIDAGNLANLNGGFISRRLGIKRGSLTFKMGEWKEVDVYGDDIHKAIYTLDFKGPNQTLYAVLGLLYEYAKLVSSVSETMTGQLPASDTPSTTVLALVEEGRKVFSSIHKRIHRAFKQELKKIFIFNSLYLDDYTYFKVVGEGRMSPEEFISISRNDYTSVKDVLPVSDPTITSKAERLLRAQQGYSLVFSNPLTASNPKAILLATEEFLKTLELPYADELISVIQEGATPPDIHPLEENSMFIKEQNPKVLPQQDHQFHLQVHEEFRASPEYADLSPAGRRQVDMHIKEHRSYIYLQTQMALAQAGAMSLQRSSQFTKL